jgi:hypothetical protein
MLASLAVPMSELGQIQKSSRATGQAALPSTTDVASRACQVRKVPRADMTHRPLKALASARNRPLPLWVNQAQSRTPRPRADLRTGPTQAQWRSGLPEQRALQISQRGFGVDASQLHPRCATLTRSGRDGRNLAIHRYSPLPRTMIVRTSSRAQIALSGRPP